MGQNSILEPIKQLYTQSTSCCTLSQRILHNIKHALSPVFVTILLQLKTSTLHCTVTWSSSEGSTEKRNNKKQKEFAQGHTSK